MKIYHIIIFTTFLISGCCSFDEKDIEFNDKELRHFSDYKIGDSIYFRSNLGDTDTIIIVAFEIEKYDQCGGIMQRKPQNSRWIRVKHLPIDKWHWTSSDMATGGETKIMYQELFWITKYPTDKTTDYNISFKDFSSRQDTTIGEYFADTLMLNALKFTDYYKVQHGYPERATGSKNIKTVYWTDKLGLTAYESKDGEVWTRESSR